MLKVSKNGFEFYPFKVTYSNDKSKNEKSLTKWALPTTEWWEKVAEKHEHITVQAIEEITPTEAQVNRLKEVQNKDLAFIYDWSYYVEFGYYPSKEDEEI